MKKVLSSMATILLGRSKALRLTKNRLPACVFVDEPCASWAGPVYAVPVLGGSHIDAILNFPSVEAICFMN